MITEVTTDIEKQNPMPVNGSAYAFVLEQLKDFSVTALEIIPYPNEADGHYLELQFSDPTQAQAFKEYAEYHYQAEMPLSEDNSILALNKAAADTLFSDTELQVYKANETLFDSLVAEYLESKQNIAPEQSQTADDTIRPQSPTLRAKTDVQPELAALGVQKIQRLQGSKHGKSYLQLTFSDTVDALNFKQTYSDAVAPADKPTHISDDGLTLTLGEERARRVSTKLGLSPLLSPSSPTDKVSGNPHSFTYQKHSLIDTIAHKFKQQMGVTATASIVLSGDQNHQPLLKIKVESCDNFKSAQLLNQWFHYSKHAKSVLFVTPEQAKRLFQNLGISATQGVFKPQATYTALITEHIESLAGQAKQVMDYRYHGLIDEIQQATSILQTEIDTSSFYKERKQAKVNGFISLLSKLANGTEAQQAVTQVKQAFPALAQGLWHNRSSALLDNLTAISQTPLPKP